MPEKVKIVARRTPGNEIADITDCFDIQIGTSAKSTSLNISVRDGWVQVHVEGRLDVQPIATNAIRFRPEDGLA